MNNFFRTVAAAASFVLIAGAATASSVTFDDLPTTFDKTPLSVFTSNGVTMEIVGFTTNGNSFGPAIFDTDNPTGNDSDLASPFTSADDENITGKLGKGLIIGDKNGAANGRPNDFAGGGWIDLKFTSSSVLFSGAIIGDIEETNGLKFFKNGDLFLQGDTRPASGSADGLFRELSLATPRLFKTTDILRIEYSGSGIVGSLTVTPVPVPASLPLLAFGLGALVVGARRRKAAKA